MHVIRHLKLHGLQENILLMVCDFKNKTCITSMGQFSEQKYDKLS